MASPSLEVWALGPMFSGINSQARVTRRTKFSFSKCLRSALVKCMQPGGISSMLGSCPIMSNVSPNEPPWPATYTTKPTSASWQLFAATSNPNARMLNVFSGITSTTSWLAIKSPILGQQTCLPPLPLCACVSTFMLGMSPNFVLMHIQIKMIALTTINNCWNPNSRVNSHIRQRQKWWNQNEASWLPFVFLLIHSSIIPISKKSFSFIFSWDHVWF